MPNKPTVQVQGRRKPVVVKAAQSRMDTAMNTKLWKHVEELATSSALLVYLAGVATERLSLSQIAFFLAAATADAAGKPATRTELIDATLDGTRGSIRNTYRQLMEPSRTFPNALGWLHPEPNPMDEREKLLRLTDEGRKVIDGALLTLRPLVNKVSETKRRTH